MISRIKYGVNFCGTAQLFLIFLGRYHLRQVFCNNNWWSSDSCVAGYCQNLKQVSFMMRKSNLICTSCSQAFLATSYVNPNSRKPAIAGIRMVRLVLCRESCFASLLVDQPALEYRCAEEWLYCTRTADKGLPWENGFHSTSKDTKHIS
jgi:hypothetical protein